jgi:hypothetical protein
VDQEVAVAAVPLVAAATNGVADSAGNVTTGTRTGVVQLAALAVALVAWTRRCQRRPATVAQTSGADTVLLALPVPAVAVAVVVPSKSGAVIKTLKVQCGVRALVRAQK